MAGGTAFIDVEIIGDERGVMKMLQHLDSCFTANAMALFMNGDVTPWLQQRARTRFDNEGDDASGKWAPLKPVTRMIRANGINRGEWVGIDPSHPINRRTGTMEEYITQGEGDVVSTGASTSLYFPKRTIGVTNGMDKKIRRAQLGDKRTTARPVLAAGLTDLSEIVTKLAYFIQRGPTSGA